MTTISISPYPRFKAFSPGTGNPLVGGQLYTLVPGAAGTPPYDTLQKATYTSSTGAALNANPIILDSNGEADIWGTGYYKFVLYDSLGNLIWSEDNVSSMPSSTVSSISEWVPQPSMTPVYISGTSFSALGNWSSTLPAGIRFQATVTAGTITGTIVSCTVSGSPLTSVVVVVNDSGALDSGLSAISTSILTPLTPALPVLSVVSKTSNYVMLGTDANQIFTASNVSGVTITLKSASAVASGAWNWFKNLSSGLLTLLGTVDGLVNPVLQRNSQAFVFSDGVSWRGSILTPSIIPWNYLSGLVLSPDAGTPTSAVSFALGCATEESNTFLMIATSAVTKILGSSWAVGSGLGGLFSGAVAINTWYHGHLIRKDADGTLDYGFDTSTTAAGRPPGYSHFRRIGSSRTSSTTTQIVPFEQIGDQYYWNASQYEATVSPGDTNAHLLTLAWVPSGYPVEAILSIASQSAGSNIQTLFSCPDANDEAPTDLASINIGPGYTINANSSQYGYVSRWRIRTNSAAQIRYRSSAASGHFCVVCHGWIDTRGKDGQ